MYFFYFIFNLNLLIQCTDITFFFFFFLQRIIEARKAHQQAKEEKERYELLAKKMHAKVSLFKSLLMTWLLFLLLVIIFFLTNMFLLETGETSQEGKEKQAVEGALNKDKNEGCQRLFLVKFF